MAFKRDYGVLQKIFQKHVDSQLRQPESSIMAIWKY